jgi:AraC-like DNA-binding protein
VEPPLRGTILASVIADVLDAAAALGHSRSSLCAKAGIDPERLRDLDAQVPLEWDIALWAALAPAAQGLEIGERLSVHTLGVVGYAAQHLRTVGDAFGWLDRYRRALHPELVADAAIREGPRGPEVVVGKRIPTLFAELREPVYAYASSLRGLLRGLTGRAVDVRRVSYPLAQPEDALRHERFFHCPVEWQAPRFEMAFDADLLALPLAKADAKLFGYLATQAERVLHAVSPDDDLRAGLQRALLAALPQGEPKQIRIATELAVSSRTLQRRLAALGTSFAEELDQLRRDRAEHLLRHSKFSAADIAMLLGYSEPAAFFRAFKRWTRTTPQQWRRAHAGA